MANYTNNNKIIVKFITPEGTRWRVSLQMCSTYLRWHFWCNFKHKQINISICNKSIENNNNNADSLRPPISNTENVCLGTYPNGSSTQVGRRPSQCESMGIRRRRSRRDAGVSSVRSGKSMLCAHVNCKHTKGLKPFCKVQSVHDRRIIDFVGRDSFTIVVLGSLEIRWIQ